MKKSLLLSALFLLLFVFANSAKAQNDSKEKYLKSLNIFIDGYNKQDYSLVKKPFSGLVKMLLHKGELKLNLEARYKEYGKIIRAENIYPSEGVLILPVIYEKDTTGIEYLSLFFTKKRKIQGGGVAIRFGRSDEGNYGSSVLHIHAHLIEPDLKKLGQTEAWRFKFGQPGKWLWQIDGYPAQLYDPLCDGTRRVARSGRE